MFNYSAKQDIILEGKPADDFYIIYNGEVELYKHIVTKHKKELDLKSYKHEQKDHNFKALYHQMKRRESETVTVSKTVHMKILGVGKLFGVEDFMSDSSKRKYSYSVVWKSLNWKIMVFNREMVVQKLKAHDHTWHQLKALRLNKLNLVKTQQKASETLDKLNEEIHKVDKEKRKTIRQQMNENVFVRNDIWDVRDGLKDLIIANFGTPKRIKKHLFPNAKPEIEEKTVDKFIVKYSNWLSKRADVQPDMNKYIDKSMIKNLLTKELIKRKRMNKYNVCSQDNIQTRYSSLNPKGNKK